jgi:membrane-bound lytic murein transglycosylase D
MKRIFLACWSSLALALPTIGSAADRVDALDIETKLKQMPCLVPIKKDEAVLSRIRTMLKGKRDTEKMIGRSASFFPIFDQYLKEYDLPADLKYVACLETELRNSVISTSGATGIWQLMPDVKEEFNLRLDGTVDERLEIGRATEAALKDMKRLYKAYKDWELVLAAYNCGAGRLAVAMKHAKSKDFARVKAFLPQQTQDYIGKFVAFTYIMKHYRAHGLNAALPSLDAQCLSSIKVFNYTSLSTVAQITGLTTETVRELNKQFGESYVPETTQGLSVILPTRVANALRDYIASPDVAQSMNLNFSPIVVDENLPKLDQDPDYFKTTYTVCEGETLEILAELFNVGAYNIALWNQISEGEALKKGQELTLYLPRIVPKRV